MAHVVALYRHPLKGFTPERVESLVVQPDGRVEGDRVLAFRFADAVAPEDRDRLDYWPKAKGLALQDFPSLATLRVRYDAPGRRVRISHGDRMLVDAGLDQEGRDELVAAVTEHVMASPEGRRLARPGRLPLVLVGDGAASRFQDRPRGYVSIHSRSSVDALGEAIHADIDDRRFRSNVVIDGVGPWTELGWTGEVRIGDLAFEAAGPIVRCLATHANPDTGVRDAKVLTTLTGAFGQDEPTLGRLLLPGTAPTGEDTWQGGVISVGDEVCAS